MILGPTNPPRYPIGESDYPSVRRGGFTYVDKTLWVADILDNSAKVLLVPRPRRFGKTLNMTTLRAFIERSDDDATDLFEDTALWRAEQGRYRTHFQRYPVLYLSFKDIKDPTWEDCFQSVRALIQDEARRLWQGFDMETRFANDSQIPMRYAMMRSPEARRSSIINSLTQLSLWVHLATGERLFILIDEYDAPLHAAWQYDYWEEAVSFFRGFLSGGLKDNPHLHTGVLTGILKVAKEGIFSGLNHLQTASIVTDTLVDRFGFTEAEVEMLAHTASRTDDLDAMRSWYNGYTFGAAKRTLIYNPWSILNYLKDPGIGPRSFWKNTSDNSLIRDLLLRHAAVTGPMVRTLLAGDSLPTRLDENVPLPALHRSARALPGLLTFSGYLTAETVAASEGAFDCDLRIPNSEVRTIFKDTFLGWLEDAAQEAATPGLTPLTNAMLAGDTSTFEEQLEALMVAMLSHHDLAGERVEAVYQAFLVGLLVHLQETHRVVSNREAGYGRADVLVLPRTPGPGAVLELKRVTRRESPDHASQRAITQLRERDYAAEVRQAGATSVHQYAVVFDGKRCWIQHMEG